MRTTVCILAALFLGIAYGCNNASRTPAPAVGDSRPVIAAETNHPVVAVIRGVPCMQVAHDYWLFKLSDEAWSQFATIFPTGMVREVKFVYPFPPPQQKLTR